MGLLGRLFSLIGFLALVAVGVGSYLYFTDYAIEATVTETGRSGDQDYVLVAPALLPSYEIRRPMEASAAPFVCAGYEVTYHIQSQAFQVFDRSKRLVYDSQTGLHNQAELARCALLG